MSTGEPQGKANKILGTLWTSLSLSGVGRVEPLLHIASLFTQEYK